MHAVWTHYLYLYKITCYSKISDFLILFYEAGKEGENNTTWSFLLLFHINYLSQNYFFLLFHFQNKKNISPSLSLLSHRQDPLLLSVLFSSPTLYRTLKNLKFKFYRLKALTLYLFFSFWALSYGCQLQQDDFLIQHFNPNPSSRTTEEWKGVPELFFSPSAILFKSYGFFFTLWRHLCEITHTTVILTKPRFIKTKRKWNENKINCLLNIAEFTILIS